METINPGAGGEESIGVPSALRNCRFLAAVDGSGRRVPHAERRVRLGLDHIVDVHNNTTHRS